VNENAERLNTGMPARVGRPLPDGAPPRGRRRLLGRLLVTAGVFGFLWLVVVFPPPVWYRFALPRSTAFMEMRARQAAREGTAYEIRHTPVPLAAIAPVMRRAVLAAEDHRFYDHGGLDWIEIRRAAGYPRDEFRWLAGSDWAALAGGLWERLRGRRPLRGASTITQQLAKNLYLSPARSLPRKLKEALLAKRLEWVLSKDRILELYLNHVEFGPGIWGVEAASRAYFQKPASRLSRREAAALAATLPAPLRSNPAYRPREMQARQEVILRRMQ
jgi:monofunctional biosynthetic peptidoglycan transglycosylase